MIESAGAKTGKAHVIKSHHNVGGLPERMHLKLLEPLRELFKDEVRRIGLELGLPREMVFRHPFPGPGLGVRILGRVTREAADLLRRADAIFIEELRAHDLYDRVAQAMAIFLPVRSVAVMGDGRRYDWVIALARRRDGRLHDRALGAAAVRFPRRRRAADRQRGARASRASSTTSPASRRRRSSGNKNQVPGNVPPGSAGSRNSGGTGLDGFEPYFLSLPLLRISTQMRAMMMMNTKSMKKGCLK